MPPIPMDQNTRIGQLENGLTYYIRHNALPENRVEFHIAQKVGAIQEEPQQRGLAHFLEHMAFNGTKNFPGNENGLGIVQWCESKGIKFGANLNAYTAVDKTVYRVSNVPTTNEAVVDSCLLILHDWSCAVNLEEEEIDKERGVIHEEWRSSDSGMMRLYTEAQPVMYPGDKYADCLPIGNIDVIDHFAYQTLRDYYAKWYRPDLQGIIVVGDIDVDQMEQKIKKLFGDIPAPVNPAKRIYYPVADNDEPIVYIGKDKEVDSPSIEIFFKHDATPDSLKSNMMYMLQDYILHMTTSMLNTRLKELYQSANPPFIYAGSYNGDYFLAKTKEAFTLSISSKAEGMHTALNTGLAELERVRRFGFTESEYERARANYLQHLESAFNEREKTKNDSYVDECIANFLDSEPMPGIEFEYSTMSQVVPNIPVAAINQTIQQGGLLGEKNQVVFIAAPDKEGVDCPTKEEVLTLLKGMKELKVEAYVDKVNNEPLIKEAPQGGKIVSEKSDAIFGTTELTLSNGIKVYIKKTDFKADEILMKGFSLGGTSLFPDADKVNFEGNILNGLIQTSGIANFSNMDLQKMLAGKKVGVSANIGNNTEGVSGNCSPKDFETMMQLTYLRFTAPRKDTDAFASFKTRMKAQLESAQANPLSSFNDSVTHTLYGDHPRYLSLQPETLDQIDYDRIIEMYRERFANAGDFIFFFVGNIDLEKAKPLIAQYLGSLPATGKKETFRDNDMDIKKGNISNIYAKEQQTPMATVLMLYSGTVKYDLKNSILMSFWSQAMNMIYTEEVREKESGTYGVSCYGNVSQYPKAEGMLQIVYQTDPAKMEHLNGIIDAQMQKVVSEGIDTEKLNKVKEYMLKKYKDNQKENSYWLNCLDEYFYNGVDGTKDYEAIVNGISADDVKEFAASMVNQGNKATVIMTVPESK